MTCNLADLLTPTQSGHSIVCHYGMPQCHGACADKSLVLSCQHSECFESKHIRIVHRVPATCKTSVTCNSLCKCRSICNYSTLASELNGLGHCASIGVELLFLTADGQGFSLQDSSNAISMFHCANPTLPAILGLGIIAQCTTVLP